ncbi:hypothetical protein [Cyanobacterium sp. Dongsha4]|uniref:hypothetical protein n=1 Tax=Cyanobacterium sp. DS4 TaxID=2878255 RepID=UPI002E80F336|nr:hypothetical protein [Cyanobacterium sp. Dongsha4]WVL02552.1 hypothetical protein Dongsha4_18865 [Cyanobacterium sp. Dongsha4]
MTQRLKDLKLISHELTQLFKIIEINSNILTKFAMASRNKINFLDELSDHYLAQETQDIFEYIGSDLMAEIKVFRNKIDELEDVVYALTKNVSSDDLDTIKRLKKMLDSDKD